MITQKYILFGLLAIIFTTSSMMTPTAAYASNHQNGTPFLQEEIDAIAVIVDEILAELEELKKLKVSWVNVTDVPAGFADGIDNDLLAELDCNTDQIIKSNGILWNCVDDESRSATVSGSPGLDCNMIRLMLGQSLQQDTRNGCDLRGAPFDIMDISGADLTGADISRFKSPAWFHEGIASQVDFTDANLSELDFYRTDLSGSNFSGADLTGALFQHAVLTDAIFTDADLTNANFNDSVDQPIGSIDCIGTPINAMFTCTG